MWTPSTYFAPLAHAYQVTATPGGKSCTTTTTTCTITGLKSSTSYRFDVAARALRKKVLLAGSCWTDAQGDSHARLEVGPRFDLMAFLAACGPRGTHRYADVRVRRITRAAPATVRPDPG